MCTKINVYHGPSTLRVLGKSVLNPKTSLLFHPSSLPLFLSSSLPLFLSSSLPLFLRTTTIDTMVRRLQQYNSLIQRRRTHTLAFNILAFNTTQFWVNR